MANHDKLEEWQRSIRRMRAQNATEPAPAAVKKGVDDKLKLLETAVNKFNTCYDGFPKQWQQLQEVEDSTRFALDFLKERFKDTQAANAALYQQAITTVDGKIDTKQGEVEALRKQITDKETALADLKKGLADVDQPLKGVETLCDGMGKYGADVAKARKDAEGIAPAERPIEAQTAIYALQKAYDDLAAHLQGNPTSDAAARLATQFKALPARLAAYRAAGQELEGLRNDLKNAEAELAEMRKARADLILLEFDSLPPPAPTTNTPATGTGATPSIETPSPATDPAGTNPDKASVGPTSQSTPRTSGEGLGGDMEGGT